VATDVSHKDYSIPKLLENSPQKSKWLTRCIRLTTHGELYNSQLAHITFIASEGRANRLAAGRARTRGQSEAQRTARQTVITHWPRCGTLEACLQHVNWTEINWRYWTEQVCPFTRRVHWSRALGWAKKRGHRLMTTILSNHNRF